MAIKAVSDSPSIPKVEYTADASVSYTIGTLLYADYSTGELKEATGSAGTTLNIQAVSTKTETSASSTPRIEAIPLRSGALFVCDCTNNTAADQLNKRHLMTDGRTVKNTNTDVATTLSVFYAISTVGAASDKKLMGYFIQVGQVTA